MDRNTFLQKIQSNIYTHGYHVTSVAGSILPRFVYTIGCRDLFGADLVFCGGEGYSQNNVTRIISEMVAWLKTGVDWRTVSLQAPGLGSFTLSEVDSSWSKLMTLGIYDVYNTDQAVVLQILPDQQHWTLEIPNTSKQFNAESEPVWQWLVKEWDYPIPSKSSVVTNLKVLYGEKATEVMRWEEDEWEIFSEAPSDIPKDEMRAIPLAILLGIDKSLEPAVHLQPGKGLWRDADELVWNDWQ
jgi:hypothetical protein